MTTRVESQKIFTMEANTTQITIYEGKNGPIKLNVDIKKETIWATQEEIALLFGVEKPAITMHLRNIFIECELIENMVCSILEYTTVYTPQTIYKKINCCKNFNSSKRTEKNDQTLFIELCYYSLITLSTHQQWKP